MKPNIYINIYGRKESAELLTELKRYIANPKSIDERVLLAIKNILASRQLSDSERAEFERFTEGETFEKIDNAEVEQQPAESDVVLEKPTPMIPEFNKIRFYFGGITWFLTKWVYFRGDLPFIWGGMMAFLVGVVIYEVILFVGQKLNL